MRTHERGDDMDRRQIRADLISDDRSPFGPDDEEGLRLASDATLRKLRATYLGSKPATNSGHPMVRAIEQAVTAALPTMLREHIAANAGGNDGVQAMGRAAFGADFSGRAAPYSIVANDDGGLPVPQDIGDVIRANDAAARAAGHRSDQAIDRWSKGEALPVPLDLGDAIRANSAKSKRPAVVRDITVRTGGAA